MSEETLTSTFTKLRRRYLSQALHILHNEDDAKDILQEAFCRLWSRRDTIHSNAEAEALTSVTVHNLCIDNLRKQNTFRTVELDANEADVIPSTSLTDKVEQEERYNKVEKIVNDCLSPLQQEILRRKEFDGESYETIASSLDMDQAAVRMQLSRIRKTIRKCYYKQQER
jgi:RNA polymerase sigma factor (sigma-70 family)